MNTLQLSPIGGTAATAAGGSPAGEAVSHPSTQPTQAPQPVAAHAAQAAQAAQAVNSVRAQAQQAAAAEEQRQATRIDTPSLDLNVGLITGTFKVYVDLTDPSDNRVIARLYGPSGHTTEPQPAPTKVRTEA